MTELSIPDMSCGHCKAAVERALAAAAPGARVEVDLARRIVRIEPAHDLPALIAALRAAGYAATAAG